MIRNLTFAEVFRMIHAGTKQIADHTTDWMWTFGHYLYSRHSLYRYPSEGTGFGTLYSRDINEIERVYTLVRTYNKSDQLYNMFPDSIMGLLDLESVFRQEIAFGSSFLGQYRRDNMHRPLMMDDFLRMYQRKMDSLQIFDPCCPQSSEPLTAYQEGAVTRWKAGEDVSHLDPDTVKKIRERAGFNLRRPYLEQRGFRHDLPHLSLNEIKNPARNVEKALWEEVRRLMVRMPPAFEGGVE